MTPTFSQTVNIIINTLVLISVLCTPDQIKLNTVILLAIFALLSLLVVKIK